MLCLRLRLSDQDLKDHSFDIKNCIKTQKLEGVPVMETLARVKYCSCNVLISAPVWCVKLRLVTLLSVCKNPRDPKSHWNIVFRDIVTKAGILEAHLLWGWPLATCRKMPARIPANSPVTARWLWQLGPSWVTPCHGGSVALIYISCVTILSSYYWGSWRHRNKLLIKHTISWFND